MNASLAWRYTHVQSHMDNVIKWHDLPRDQQLNVICDGLAKSAALQCIHKYSQTTPPSSLQRLPYEDVAIFVNAVKQTSDPASAIRFACGKDNAKHFLVSEKGWSTTQFDEVDWENLHSSLHSKPDGFRTWLSKQHSDFCATRVQTKRWFGTDDTSCPSCLQVEETAAHLCQCPDPARSRLLADDTAELTRWMSIHDNTHPEIIDWVEKYISSRGKPIFCCTRDFPSITDLIESQYKIGWRNFMEGRIS
jgi:hypothetical protein